MATYYNDRIYFLNIKSKRSLFDPLMSLKWQVIKHSVMFVLEAWCPERNCLKKKLVERTNLACSPSSIPMTPLCFGTHISLIMCCLILLSDLIYSPAHFDLTVNLNYKTFLFNNNFFSLFFHIFSWILSFILNWPLINTQTCTVKFKSCLSSFFKIRFHIFCDVFNTRCQPTYV